MNIFTSFIQKSGLDFKQYQFDGVKWAIENELSKEKLISHDRIRGGFIADEMGLGKTITMLGIIFANFMMKTLIVLPNSLIEQWATEIFRLTGYKPLIYHGPGKKKIKVSDLEKSIIVLTTYSAVALNKKQQNKLTPLSLLHCIKWNRIAFDEAHHLRNANSRYIGARLLQTGVRWLISGTPIQNKKKDFYLLCSVLGLPRSYYTEKENIGEFFRLYFLHRTKKDVGIIIPGLLEKKEIVNWKTEEERTMAYTIHNQLKGDSTDKLRTILLAQKICTLPSLLSSNVNKNKSKIAILESLSTSKMDAVIETILGRKGNGAGKLIFCRFIAEIDEVMKRLRLGGMYCIANLDGRVKTKKDKIGRLNDKYEALVVQIQTGCEGLNLQKNYSEVYFVSPNWNPAVEAQAVARCHRIGQELPVVVFKYEMDELSRDQLHQLRLGSHLQLSLQNISQEEISSKLVKYKNKFIVEEDDDCKRNCSNLGDGDPLSNLKSMDQYVNSVQNKKKGLIAGLFA
jgi:SNF2 family DNA or RNA helicase